MRKRLVWAVLAVSLLLAIAVDLAGSSRSDAQSELDAARRDVAAATESLEAVLSELEATQLRGDALAEEYWQIESGLVKVQGEVAASEAVLAELADRREGLRAEVRVIALDQYVLRSDDLTVGDHESEADRAAAETLARLVVGGDNDAIDQLALVNEEHEQNRERLLAQRDEHATALAGVQRTQSALFSELDQLEALRETLGQELQALESALDQLEQAEQQRVAAAAEQARIAEERRRAEAAAAAAAERARLIPTPAPTAIVTPLPTATPLPTPTAEAATPVPNPQPSEPFPTPTPVPGTPVPNPQPSEPFPTATSVPNPQPSEPLPTPTPIPSAPETTATVVPNPQPSSTGIVCPLAGPFTHTDDFNSPRAVGGVHRANDLIAAQGVPVIAVATGSIEHRNSSVGGMSAHLKGDNGDYYFFTHLSGYENVGAGRVAAGTIIGYVGMTGNAPIPHLHFEIHRGGYGNYTKATAAGAQNPVA